ncbi:MAG TPA: FHA domain-containing serine/threonine-protein kinase [Planctomycetota bacterium]|nr:FHA domain-containing serine/threonine-protein kinase [Planctomycetota bacterium]
MELEKTVVGEETPYPIGAHISGCLVERKLGQGGMGTVYLAKRDEDGTQVVMKFLAPEQVSNARWRARFVREAEMMKRIRHPNIVEVFAIQNEGNEPHIVMEYVDGKGLDVLLKEGGFDPLEAARVTRDIALGLAEAHKTGIIHRDVKPANVLLSRAGAVKILDFGLAKEVLADDGLSMPGQILGTPHFMAPEQWGHHKVDARCDVFSLGVTLYNLLTGKLPFPADSPSEIQKLVNQGEYVPPRVHDAKIPEDLELVVFQMMAIDRRYRYASAEQCVEALEAFLGHKPVEVPRLVERKTQKRYPLVPRSEFTIGRDATVSVTLLNATVSRQHAKIERTATGYKLTDLGSSAGTFVGGMKVKEVVLKDGDDIRFGQVTLDFKDAGFGKLVSQTRKMEGDRLKLEAVEVPFVDALADAADKRVVLSLLEDLAADAPLVRAQAAREALREHLGGEVAESVGSKLETRVKRHRGGIPSYLFAITHENLGEDMEAWLSWWDQARTNYPPQFVPKTQGRGAILHVTKGEPAPRVVKLEGAQVFNVGRDEKSKVALNNASVSRLHATILRLHDRLVIRDEGSRFGTVVNGSNVRMAFLSPGDRVALGKVELTFDLEAAVSVGENDLMPVDGEAFSILEELQSPSVATGLVQIVEAATNAGWIDATAARIHEDPKKAQELAQKVKRTYTERARRARMLLPKLLGEDKGDSVQGWKDLLSAKRSELPPQVVPVGWIGS